MKVFELSTILTVTSPETLIVTPFSVGIVVLTISSVPSALTITATVPESTLVTGISTLTVSFASVEPLDLTSILISTVGAVLTSVVALTSTGTVTAVFSF